MTTPSEQDILDRVTSILRQDLKLGDEASISPDTRLIGGDFDFDSIDVLLIVTSLEKKFGFVIANDAISPRAFASVGTLVRWVQEQVALQETTS